MKIQRDIKKKSHPVYSLD